MNYREYRERGIRVWKAAQAKVEQRKREAAEIQEELEAAYDEKKAAWYAVPYWARATMALAVLGVVFLLLTNI